MAVTLAEIQSWPEVPAIAHYCSLFRASFDLLDFEIEEFETALLSRDAPQDDMFSCTLLERLVVKLLRGCLPANIAVATHEGNFSIYLKQLIETKQEEAEEEGQHYDFVDPFEANDIEDFNELPTLDQVRVLNQLTQFRLEAGDVTSRLKDLDPDGMRVEPLGEDSEGVVYWYFFGVRLYKEVKMIKPKKPRKKKETKEVDEKQPKKKKVEEEQEEEEEIQREDPGWYVACNSEAEWSDLAAKYKKSKKKQDRELYEVLVENFIPEISKMFHEKEREEKIRLMMMNKRSSGRLDRKREEKEKEFETRRLEMEKQELERKAEEEKQMMREKENKQKGRAERAKQRELVFPSSHPSRLQGNRERDVARLKTSPREVVESDHDYTRRKNPALKEWKRLASNSSDEGDGHAQRNLRF